MATSESVLKYTESDKIAILKEYGRTPESVQADVVKIKEWMSKQPHLPEVADDELIERFLLINKGRVEIAKEKLDMYYTLRTLLPELYGRNPCGPEMQKLMDAVYIVTLPKLTHELHRVMMVKLKDTNPDNFDAVMFTALMLAIVDIRLREDYNLSEIQIIDLSGVSLSHLLKFNPFFVQKAGLIVNKLLPNRLNGVHFINSPAFVDSFAYLLKIILNAKLIQRVHFHRDAEPLPSIVPIDVLPSDYGGNEKSLDELNEIWRKKLLESEGILDHLRQMTVDENLRAEKNFLDDHLGIEGNFRKLDLD